MPNQKSRIVPNRISSLVTKKKKQQKSKLPKYNVKIALFIAVGLILAAGFLLSRFGSAGGFAFFDDGSVCLSPETFPSAPNGGMQYVNYSPTTTDINAVKATYKVDTSMSGTEETYLQFYEANIGRSHQYFGMQTDAPGAPAAQMLIFSKFVDSSEGRAGFAAEVRSASGSYAHIGTSEGNFVSLRRHVSMSISAWHTVEVKRAEAASLTLAGTARQGDWYDYYYDGQSIGGIWFERNTASVDSPAAFQNYGGSWTEYWANNGTVLRPVPKQQFSMKPLQFNGGYGYNTVRSVYSAMPNSDTSYVVADNAYEGDLLLKMGGDTPRCHPDNQVIDVTKTTSSPTTTVTTTVTTTPPWPTTTVTPTTTDPPPTTTITPAPTTTITPPPADTQAPTAPTRLTRRLAWDPYAFSYYLETNWQASQDNVGVKDYTVKRNGVILTTTDKLGYRDYKIQAGTWYRYEVQARDAAGNLSPVSSVNALGQCFLIWCWLR